MKGFGNNDKNKTGSINQHHLPDSDSVLLVRWKQNLYWQHEHHCMVRLLKPLRTLILLLNISFKIPVFFELQRQRYPKVHATGLQSYLLQFEQMPFTTIFTLSSEKLLGRFIVGTGMSFKQNVWLHFVQRK